jgi:hypothetical protein
MPIEFEHHAETCAERVLVINEEYSLAANLGLFGDEIAPNPRRPGVSWMECFEVC